MGSGYLHRILKLNLNRLPSITNTTYRPLLKYNQRIQPIQKCTDKRNLMKEPKYPENIQFKLEIVKARRTIKEVAEKIGVSREILTKMVNGHYKGGEIKKS